MARTKASVGAKVASGKSSKARCSVAAPTSYGSSSAPSTSSSKGGGNPVCPRETPKWQRPITTFFCKNGKDSSDDEANKSEAEETTSTRKSRRNVIESDEEGISDQQNKENKPKNQVLDETIELEPLTGENSHKLEEFYEAKPLKGKGLGKKTKQDLEAKRSSLKRDLSDEESDQEGSRASKKVKIG